MLSHDESRRRIEGNATDKHQDCKTNHSSNKTNKKKYEKGEDNKLEKERRKEEA